MSHTHRSVQRSLAAVAACTAVSLMAVIFLPAVTYAAPTPVTVRIEGLNSTILPEMQLATDTRTLPMMSGTDCFGLESSGASQTANGPTPVGALADGAAAAGVTYDLTDHYVTSFGLGVCRVGSEASDGGFWQYKVNNKLPSVGPDQYLLSGGDRVLWFRTSLYPAPTLDLATPAKVQAGMQFTVAVSAYDDAGQATPAADAMVKLGLGSVPVKTDASGDAVLSAPDAGAYQVSATKDGTIRSPAYSICTYKVTASECDPPSPMTASGTPAAHVEKPIDGRIYATLRRVSGSVSGGGSNAGVRLRIKRISSSRCTFWKPKTAKFATVAAKRHLRSSTCGAASYFDVPVDSSGSWTYTFARSLKAGVYALNARAVGAGGNIEATIKDGVNRVRFAIRHRKRGK